MNKINIFVWLENFKKKSIFIRDNMAVIVTKSTMRCVKEILKKNCHKFNMNVWIVGRKSKHFMFVNKTQYGSNFLTCMWM
jgi:hypothetical protein